MVPTEGAEDGGPLNLQIEPEVALACRVVWHGDTVSSLQPFALGAFNDCSIRRPNAPKISYKKNWGPASKGVAHQFFDISDLTPDGPTATLRLLCHLRTADGVHHEYGVDSPLLGYSYHGEVLLDWIVERLANQKGAPETPLEDVGRYWSPAGVPSTCSSASAPPGTPSWASRPISSPETRAIVRVSTTPIATPLGISPTGVGTVIDVGKHTLRNRQPVANSGGVNIAGQQPPRFDTGRCPDRGQSDAIPVCQRHLDSLTFPNSTLEPRAALPSISSTHLGPGLRGLCGGPVASSWGLIRMGCAGGAREQSRTPISAARKVTEIPLALQRNEVQTASVYNLSRANLARRTIS